MGPNDVPRNQLQYATKMESRADFWMIKLWVFEIEHWLRQVLIIALLLRIPKFAAKTLYRKKCNRNKFDGQW